MKHTSTFSIILGLLIVTMTGPGSKTVYANSNVEQEPSEVIFVYPEEKKKKKRKNSSRCQTCGHIIITFPSSTTYLHDMEIAGVGRRMSDEDRMNLAICTEIIRSMGNRMVELALITNGSERYDSARYWSEVSTEVAMQNFVDAGCGDFISADIPGDFADAIY